MFEIIGIVALVICICISVAVASDGANRDFSGWSFFWFLTLGILLVGSATGYSFNISDYKTLILGLPKYLALYVLAGIAYAYVNFKFVAKSEVAKSKVEIEHYLSDAYRYDKFSVDSYKILGRVQSSIQSNPSVTLDKRKLKHWFSSWAIYWPFYLTNNIIGDFLVNFFDHVVNSLYGRMKNYVDRLISSTFSV